MALNPRSATSCSAGRWVNLPIPRLKSGAKSSILVARRNSSSNYPSIIARDETKAYDSNGSSFKIRPSRSSEEGLPGTGLERMPTRTIVRSLLLGAFFSTPSVFKPGFAILRKIAESRSPFLSPDANPILRALLRPLMYDQFCAGRNRPEIYRTRDTIKQMGYSGIVLCYGREIQVSQSNEMHSTGPVGKAEIEQWRDGNLETLDMVKSGDWLGIKFSGAGSEVTNALIQGDSPSPEFVASIDAICRKAQAQDCRIWIDAEQQVLQNGIDSWTIDLMRRYNKDGKTLVYNTLQSYLKASRIKLKKQLALADQEGWTLAIKLVRGAYIGNDRRELIHDTKQQTDDSYNGIVQDLLSGRNLGFEASEFPKVKLILAGHNPESVAAAWNHVRSLNEQGQLKVLPDFAQLQGMGDDLGCRFLQQCERAAAKEASGITVPKVYKCLTWGSIQECMQYLIRRAVENTGSTDRMRDGMSAYISELKRRLVRTVTKN